MNEDSHELLWSDGQQWFHFLILESSIDWLLKFLSLHHISFNFHWTWRLPIIYYAFRKKHRIMPQTFYKSNIKFIKSVTIFNFVWPLILQEVIERSFFPNALIQFIPVPVILDIFLKEMSLLHLNFSSMSVVSTLVNI